MRDNSNNTNTLNYLKSISWKAKTIEQMNYVLCFDYNYIFTTWISNNPCSLSYRKLDIIRRIFGDARACIWMIPTFIIKHVKWIDLLAQIRRNILNTISDEIIKLIYRVI